MKPPVKPREITLYGPAGGRKQVRPTSALARQLLAAGWRREGPPAPPEPAYRGFSDTARQARSDLATLSPSAWITDWGAVLCAALDETERDRMELAVKVTKLGGLLSAALETMKRIAGAWMTWLRKSGRGGEPAEADLRPAAADFERAVTDEVLTFTRFAGDCAVDLALSIPGVAGVVDQEAKERAATSLDELARKAMPADIAEEDRRKILDAVRSARAAIFGGAADDEEVPS